MTTLATGTFEITRTPHPGYETPQGPIIGRMSFAKTFSGDLQATSTVEMLSAGTDVRGSAGYVAIECVKGTLGGRSGGFILQHFGTMNRGSAELLVAVIPDSGTGELAGLSGQMRIEIVETQHSYSFEYQLGAGAV